MPSENSSSIQDTSSSRILSKRSRRRWGSVTDLGVYLSSFRARYRSTASSGQWARTTMPDGTMCMGRLTPVQSLTCTGLAQSTCPM